MLRANWCGLASIGASLILFAIAAGAELVVAIALAGAAALELGWGLATLRAGRCIMARAALAGCAVLTAGAVAMLFAGITGALPVLALLALHASTAALIVLDLRRSQRSASDAEARRRSLAMPLFVALITAEAMLVAAITTPALARTVPGDFAVPHGAEHSHHR